MQGSKPCAFPLGYTPKKSIASHPFYGFFLYISEIITVAKPRWVLLYHSHWLLLVTWDFRRWSHRSWLVRPMLHCYRVDFYKTFSPWKGLIWNLQTFNLVADMGFEPMTYRLWACRASSAPIRDIVRLVWASHQEAVEIFRLEQGNLPTRCMGFSNATSTLIRDTTFLNSHDMFAGWCGPCGGCR